MRAKKTRALLQKIIGLIGILLIPILGFTQQIGDPGWTYDASKYDSNYPSIKEWAKAGVQGGIPYRNSLTVKKRVKPGQSIQGAIDEVSRSGGGVVLLEKGTHRTTKELTLRTNVVLRGVSKEGVTVLTRLRGTSKSKKNAINFRGTKKAGIEDITFRFDSGGIKPVDDRNSDTNKFCKACWQNDPKGKKDLYVRFVFMDKNTQNSWVDNCRFYDAGTDPLWIQGKYITCRNNLIDGCINKGSGGNGYYDVRGEYILVANETVKRIRHYAIQQGAKYTVTIGSNFEVDVNFHNKDRGHNLVEKTKITIPRWRGWGTFGTGGARYGHSKPGPLNIIYNNTTDLKGKKGEFSGDRTVYTFTGYGSPSVQSRQAPKAKTFYAVKRKGGSTPPPNPTPTPTPDTKQILADGDYYIESPFTSERLLSREKENHGAVMHNPGNWRDQTWTIRHLGNNMYTLRNGRTGRYLEVPRGECANGSNVSTWTNASSNHKKWQIEKTGSFYTFRPMHCLGKGLDRAKGAKSANVHIWEYRSSNKNQQWKVVATRGAKGNKALLTFNSFQVYPSPATTYVKISGVPNTTFVQIYDGNGRLLITSKVSADEKVDVSSLSSGLYFLTIPGYTSKKFTIRN